MKRKFSMKVGERSCSRIGLINVETDEDFVTLSKHDSSRRGDR